MAGYDDDCNFYVDEDEIAYTEDGVVVYNIFIYNVPRDLTAEYVQSYFCEFGRVRKVQLLPDRQAGYVHFADPLAAARALEKQEHTLSGRGKRCNVEACHSWHQPPATSGTAAESSENVATQSGTMTLLELSDECLLHIFSRLKLSQQIYFALAHSRLLALFEIFSYKEFSTFHLDELDALTRPQQRELFRMVGNRMETIQIRYDSHKDNNCERSIVFLCRWCTNVKSISVSGCSMPNPLLFKLLQKMQQITELRLVNLSLGDNAILEISKLRNLRTLSLQGSNELTGRYLDRLTTVQQLDLTRCRGVKASFLRDALIALPQLTALTLNGWFGNLTAVFEHIPRRCSKLEVLKINLSAKEPLDCVVQLPSLKKLTLICRKPIQPVRFNQHLEQLSKVEQLQYLEFSGYEISEAQAVLLAQFKLLRGLHLRHAYLLDDACLREFAKLKLLEELDVSRNDRVTDEGVDCVLRGCKKLRKLDLSRCTAITEGLLHRAIDVLEQTYCQRNALVEIDVRGTAIRRLTVEADAAYRAASARNLLKMHCDSQRPHYRVYDASDSD